MNTKILRIISVALFCITMQAQQDPIIGTWLMTGRVEDGVDTFDNCAALNVYVFNADGTMSGNDYEDEGNGCEDQVPQGVPMTWVQLEENHYQYTIFYTYTFEFYTEFSNGNNTLVVTEDGDITTFVKQDTSTPQQTYVPDDNFEQALIDLGYDDVLDDYVTTANISGVTNLDVGSKNIASLQGIEDFTSLTHLFCYDNQLTSLDVSQNISLTFLLCNINQLTSLDISTNTALTFLDCGGNQLTSLDLSSNTALTSVSCYYNQLTSLDVSLNLELQNISFYANQITGLDISQNTAIYAISGFGNQLTYLNVANGNNANFTHFYVENNPNLTCIQVDDPSASYLENQEIWKKDEGASYSVDCGTASNENFSENTILFYPNPVKDILFISQKVKKIQIHDIAGKTLISQENASVIDTSYLKNGIYLAIFTAENNSVITQKIIKN